MKLYVLLRLQYLALFHHSCYKAMIIPSLHPSSGFLSFSMEQNMVTHSIDNYRETLMDFISSVCVAYYEFPGGTAFKMKRSADYSRLLQTSHYSRTSSIQHVSSSLNTSHVLIHPWTTAKHSDGHYRVKFW